MLAAAFVGDDCEQPGFEIGPGAKSPEVTPHVEQSALHSIVRVGRRMEQSDGEPMSEGSTGSTSRRNSRSASAPVSRSTTRAMLTLPVLSASLPKSPGRAESGWLVSTSAQFGTLMTP